MFFVLTRTVCAQNHFAGERIYVNIPSSQTATSTGIAAYINSHYDTDDKKIAAIYSWLTANIRYDADSIHYVILDEDNEERVRWALRRKRGVCENFAAIFTDLATQCGINSFVVEGFTKQAGSVDRTAHVWCIAYVDNKWQLFDPTWDAGRVASMSLDSHYKYFKVPPEEFIETHLPFDPVYQLLNYPVDYNDFVSGNTSQKNRKSYMNYNDSLSAIKKMDRVSRYQNELSRIENAGWPAPKVETKVKRIKFQMEVLNQDSDADLYNAAVDDYNSAINSLNVFLTYRNNQFQPEKPNAEIEILFQNVQNLLASANEKIKRISSSKATLQLDTGDIQKKLDDLKNNLHQQRLFFKNYSDTASKE
jgi:transglutaminase/protease-like cytokinesis protein 3